MQEGEGHVEHYRPKKRLSGVKHDGYWWKAFDWTNLRLSHPTANRRMTDFLSLQKAGKGSYFPVRNEKKRARSSRAEVHETPVLLDPVVPSDTQLICFSEDSGCPRPRFRKAQNKWLHRRAEESISFYHLDEGTWNSRR